MTRPARLIAIACLVAALPCAAQQLNDPANLAGERVSPQALADDLPINHGAAALQQLLLKLRTRASLMMIVAHPDDEDGGMLTYESRGLGARVAMLTLTRGEGGQNLMSADFDDALGLIRTQELLAEDRYTGVDQFFGTEVDFGFSKTKEETLAKWTHDRVLYDAVRCVRLYRPLVIASVFVGGPTDGHGHHQVAGEIAQEVFVAAADPKVFPEMGLAPWAPLKVYARVPFSRVTAQGMFDYATGKTIPVLFHNYVTGTDSHVPPVPTVQIHEGEPAVVFGKPALGMEGLSYVQFARKGLALQKTQIGPGVRTAPAGRSDSPYTLMASRVGNSAPGSFREKGSSSHATLSSFAASGGPASALPATESSLFDGIDTTFPAIASLAPHAPATLRATLTQIDNKLAEAQQLFDPANVAATAPPLREAIKILDSVIEGTASSTLPPTEKANLLHELRVKRVQLNNALVLGHGLTLTAQILQTPLLTSQHSTKVHFTLEAKSDNDLTLETIYGNASGFGSALIDEFPNNGEISRSGEFPLNLTTPEATRPYFSRPDLEQPFYDIFDPALRDAPVTPAPLSVVAKLQDEGVQILVSAFASSGEAFGVMQAAVFVEPVSLSLVPSVGILTPGEKAIHVEGEVKSSQSIHQLGGIEVRLQSTSKRLGKVIDRVVPQEKGKVIGKDEIVEITIPASRIKVPSFTLLADAVSFENTMTRNAHGLVDADHITYYSDGYRPVGYPGLAYTNYYTPATYRATTVDVTTAPNLHIAYLPGTGDDVPTYLPNLGVTPTLLNTKDLTLDNLKQYDAVILGVRAYAAHPELAHAGSQPLNDFAAAGGVVIVQYNTNGDAAGTAPYPYNLPGDSAHNVVVEAQPVTVLEPNAPLLNWPNKITAADFHNWVAEYGHGFASTWAPEYHALIEVHDPDQDPQKGGLLVAKVGKGAYIYCALALYRQLPEGVPGAYRLFANLLSYAKNPNRPR
jgi:LmbE family N-acetylglucosaminyl deacetylase